MTEPSQITRFGLIRHAETLWNCEKRIQGQSDSPLTAKGKTQAARWGRRLSGYSWDRMVVSDTGRAKETAGILNALLKLPLSFDSRLREQDWGRWTGKTITQVITDAYDDLAELESAGWNFCPPGGEDRLTLLKRSQAALSETAQKWPGMSILIVSHEGVIKSLIYHLCARKFLPSEPAVIKPYHLHRIIFGPNGLQLEKTNALALD